MKRLLIPLAMTVFLLLAGCGENERLEAGLEAAREEWKKAEAIIISAEVVSQPDDRIFECAVLCRRSDEETEIELTAPESIAGISAVIGSGETQLRYDGVILALGDEGQGTSSPLGGIALAAESIIGGHLAGIWEEEDGELAVGDFYVSENEYMRLWFNAENFVPIHAELVSEGKTVLKCSITSFTEE